jgi:hypothetical protein
MKFVIIWSNGDMEKIEVSKEFLDELDVAYCINEHKWDSWVLVKGIRQDGTQEGFPINMAHVRRVYLEE